MMAKFDRELATCIAAPVLISISSCMLVFLAGTFGCVRNPNLPVADIHNPPEDRPGDGYEPAWDGDEWVRQRVHRRTLSDGTELVCFGNENWIITKLPVAPPGEPGYRVFADYRKPAKKVDWTDGARHTNAEEMGIEMPPPPEPAPEDRKYPRYAGHGMLIVKKADAMITIPSGMEWVEIGPGRWDARRIVTPKQYHGRMQALFGGLEREF